MDFVVLESRYFVSSDIAKDCQITRVVRDYEIDIELDDGRSYMYNGGEAQTLRRGDILIRKPNDVVSAIGIQKSYMLTLDFSCQSSPQNYHRVTTSVAQIVCENPLIKELPFVIHPQSSDEFIALYRKLFALSDCNSPAAKALVQELIFKINAELCHQKYKACKPQETMCDVVLTHMRKNLHKNITLNELADLVHLEKSYLTRRFRHVTGKTPIEALIEMRLEYATEIIGSTDMKIVDVAELCGYKTTSYFIAEYKKKYGVTPEVHRKMLTQKHSL